MQKKVGVILVNYNGEKYIANCVNSLLNQTYQNIAILLWDNHSSDASVEVVRHKYPQIYLVESKYNYGYAKANNLAVNKMFRIEAELEYILLLNVDTVAEPSLIENLLSKADENTVTTAHIYLDKFGKQIWYAGGELQLDMGRSDHLYLKNCKEAQRVTFVSGCCMLIHRDIIKRFGLFDPAYYMYYEDTDLCMRWYMHNVCMYYIPQARLWHKVGASVGGVRNPVKEYYMVRNRLYFMDKYKRYMRTRKIVIICAMLKDVLLDFSEYRGGMIRATGLGILDFYFKKMGPVRYKLD